MSQGLKSSRFGRLITSFLTMDTPLVRFLVSFPPHDAPPSWPGFFSPAHGCPQLFLWSVRSGPLSSALKSVFFFLTFLCCRRVTFLSLFGPLFSPGDSSLAANPPESSSCATVRDVLYLTDQGNEIQGVLVPGRTGFTFFLFPTCFCAHFLLFPPPIGLPNNARLTAVSLCTWRGIAQSRPVPNTGPGRQIVC